MCEHAAPPHAGEEEAEAAQRQGRCIAIAGAVMRHAVARVGGWGQRVSYERYEIWRRMTRVTHTLTSSGGRRDDEQ